MSGRGVGKSVASQQQPKVLLASTPARATHLLKEGLGRHFTDVRLFRVRVGVLELALRDKVASQFWRFEQ